MGKFNRLGPACYAIHLYTMRGSALKKKKRAQISLRTFPLRAATLFSVLRHSKEISTLQRRTHVPFDRCKLGLDSKSPLNRGGVAPPPAERADEVKTLPLLQKPIL